MCSELCVLQCYHRRTCIIKLSVSFELSFDSSSPDSRFPSLTYTCGQILISRAGLTYEAIITIGRWQVLGIGIDGSKVRFQRERGKSGTPGVLRLVLSTATVLYQLLSSAEHARESRPPSPFARLRPLAQTEMVSTLYFVPPVTRSHHQSKAQGNLHQVRGNVQIKDTLPDRPGLLSNTNGGIDICQRHVPAG